MEEFIINQTAGEITINNEKIKAIFNKNGVTVKPKNENKTLEELKQKTINHLYDSVFVDSNEVNLLKLLLENKFESSESSNLDYKKVGINFDKS